MTTTTTTTATTPTAAAFFAVIFSAFFSLSTALGSGSTVAVLYDSGTVCGILAGKSPQSVSCVRSGVTLTLSPNASFESIAAGRGFLCGLRSGGLSIICWDSEFRPKRIYPGRVPLSGLSVGEDQVCAVERDTSVARCWRGGDGFQQLDPVRLRSVTSGRNFSCGILLNTSRVYCWGSSQISRNLQLEFSNVSMNTLVTGVSHLCGVNLSGFLVCKGNNDSGQLNSPPRQLPFEFSGLALEANRSCAIRQNRTVVCWGGDEDRIVTSQINDIQFELIVSGTNYTCGLVRVNLTILCWGDFFVPISIGKIIPGVCTESSCGSYGVYPDSEDLCSESGRICESVSGFGLAPPPALSPLPQVVTRTRNRMNKGLLAFAIVGSVGAASGIVTVIYCIWTGICCRQKKIHNSVQPTITTTTPGDIGSLPISSASSFGPISRSATIRRQTSRAMRRQRSGTSSKHPERAEEFTLSELAAATNNFSPDNKIGAGSFGTVYRGKLAEGSEVAIKRGETGLKMKKFQEKETAFQSELAFLSRLHHKHLVGLVGFCEENDERLLVYEYMKNGALYDHLHSKKNGGNDGKFEINLLNSWKMRIKIVLDAARGIEYLHNYAVPPIIHRDIKSSNILLDANWTARVSDFGLSLMSPETEGDHLSMKAAGTLGYMDPEYYGLHHLTTKSDVYGLGVVLLEVLTGRRAIFKEENGTGPTSVVDFAVRRIVAGELVTVLDPRVGPPEGNDSEAVELVAYTAVHCVNLEGKDRPTMSDVVANLERALSLCEDSHGSISSGTISLASD